MLRLLISLILAVTFTLSAPAANAQSRLWQTNAEGDDIHIFDVATGALIKKLVVGKNPHGVAAPDDGRFVVVSVENNGASAGSLVWIDPESFAITGRLDVGREPHAIAISPDGRWVYVPCRDGDYWVVDAEARRVVTRISTGGRPHNTVASPDGRFMFLSPMGKPKSITIVDLGDGHRVVDKIPFSASVRPPALAYDRGLFFQHVDSLNGFEVADIKTRSVIARIEHSAGLGMRAAPGKLGFLGRDGFSRCHGLAVRPGEEEVWSVCGQHLSVHELTSGNFEETLSIRLGAKGYWLIFSPDGAYAFVAAAHENSVYVFDAERKTLLRTLKAGKGPKRALVLNETP